METHLAEPSTGPYDREAWIPWPVYWSAVWVGGLAGTRFWVNPASVATDPNAAVVAQNHALGAVAALLLGLIGAVIGGWMSSGEPMNFTHYRTRTIHVEHVPEREIVEPSIRRR